MNIQIDFRSDVPIYLQLVEKIQQMVIGQALKPGDQLPTVRQMATDLRINFNTVARAYRMLDEAGVISTQHGRGTYIWSVPPAGVTHELRKHMLDGLVRRCLQEAVQIGCQPDEIRGSVEAHLTDWQEGLPPRTDTENE